MNFSEQGYEIKKNYVSEPDIRRIKSEISISGEQYANYGIRGADKKFSSIYRLAHSDNFLSLATEYLGSKPRIVRVIFFDKTANKNWLVSWHQDKTIALNKKEDIQGWGPWSIKDNTHHVQPSIEVLEHMLTFRLHLDHADKNNGCLKLIPKSHTMGLLSQKNLNEVVNSNSGLHCEVEAGDLLIMKPHIIHSSSKSNQPGHRRIVHIEYSNFELPDGLDWA